MNQGFGTLLNWPWWLYNLKTCYIIIWFVSMPPSGEIPHNRISNPIDNRLMNIPQSWVCYWGFKYGNYSTCELNSIKTNITSCNKHRLMTYHLGSFRDWAHQTTWIARLQMIAEQVDTLDTSWNLNLRKQNGTSPQSAIFRIGTAKSYISKFFDRIHQ